MAELGISYMKQQIVSHMTHVILNRQMWTNVRGFITQHINLQCEKASQRAQLLTEPQVKQTTWLWQPGFF